MPSFTPKSDKELNSERLLPKAEYDFEITKAEDKNFKTGSQGIALTVAVYLPDGSYRLVNDNLVFSPGAMFKVSNFCKATGLYGNYERGRIDATDCEGRQGRCKVDIEPEGEYPAKNKISSYVVPKAEKQKQVNTAVAQEPKPSTPAPGATADPDEDVPFAILPREYNFRRLA